VTKSGLKLLKFSLSYSIYFVPDAWLFCIVVNFVICSSLGLLYISVVILLVLIFGTETVHKVSAGNTIEKNSSDMGRLFPNLNAVVAFSALTLLVGRRKGIQSVKMGEWWRWALLSPDGVAPSRRFSVSASVHLFLYHKIQKFSSGTS